MEAQPAALLIALLTVLVAGTGASASFGAGFIALVALALQWWAMIVERIATRKLRGKQIVALHALGWLSAFAVGVGPYLAAMERLENLFNILLGTVLVTWFWRRGMLRAQAGFEYGALARTFKAGFGILLGILLIAILSPELQTLRDGLTSALPVFFLSGLVMLSLVRLGVIRASRRVLDDDAQQADQTRSWLVALTVFGVILVAIVIVIESVFSFATFELVLTALAPLWNALGTLVGWILYGIIFILSPIFYLISWLVGLFQQHGSSNPQQQSAKPPKSPIQQSLNSRSFPPELLTIGRWVFLALVLLITLLVVRASLRHWLVRNSDEGVEEERESLDARSLLGQHWREWWQRRRRRDNNAGALEPLDPASARARYREMLQALATSNVDLARTPTETAVEYQARLRLHFAEAALSDRPTCPDALTDDMMLAELTQIYANERYGGKFTDERHRANLSIWVPRLIGRLTAKASSRAIKRRPDLK
ncbi:MAG TPA: DUF4129 domain-containing protein [Ktedonobacteraceae bacterium]|nr:DUF4129 domain-containing protein [Ktedonobacteraceae bacterium]